MKAVAFCNGHLCRNNWKSSATQELYSQKEFVKDQKKVGLSLGMGRYQKCVHREVANAKPYRFWDSVFQNTPTKHGRSS